MKKLFLLLIVFVFSVFTLGCDLAEVNVGPEVFDGPTVDQCDEGAAGSITFRIGDGKPRTLCADKPGVFFKPWPDEPESPYFYVLDWINPLNKKEAMNILFLRINGELYEDFLIQYFHESAPEIHGIGGYNGAATIKTVTIDGKVAQGTFSGTKLEYLASETEVNVIEVSGQFNIPVREVSLEEYQEMNQE